MKMLLHFFVICTLPVQILGCGDTLGPVPALQGKSRLNTASQVSGIDDGFIRLAWYSAIQDGKQYLMPDNNTIPSLYTCGGVYPIYIQGNHPVVQALNETPQQVTVCIRTEVDVCQFTEKIDIRKCGGKVEYYLVSTFKQYSSYCFDPPEIRGVADKDFVAAPTQIVISKVIVQPMLEYINTRPTMKLRCDIQSLGGAYTNLVVHTKWYINASLQFQFELIGKTTPLSEKELRLTGLGKNISCGVGFSNTTKGKMTSISMSDVFFAGIKVDNKDVIINKTDDNANIYFTKTLPFGCSSPNSTSCKFGVRLFYPGQAYCHQLKGSVVVKKPPRETEANQQTCGVEFQGDPVGDFTVGVTPHSMKISTTDMNLEDPRSYILQLEVGGKLDHTIWDGYKLEPVRVNVFDDLQYKDKICSAMNDPHMTTFAGYSYEHQYPGDSILYRNIKYDSEVQIRTKSCNTHTAWCTCAIAIRSGRDVFRINYCSDSKLGWVLEMTSCDEKNSTDKPSIIINEDQTQFYTPIGTKISVFDINKDEGIMNINIRLAPKDVNNADGLCNTIGKNKEMVDRNGQPTNDHFKDNYGHNHHPKFSEAWRIKSTDKNYLNDTCYKGANDWTKSDLSLYCVCETCLNGSCNGYKPEAHCSRSQYLECPVLSEKTERECKRWEDRCKTQTTRIKRETTRSRHFEHIHLKQEKKHSAHKRQTKIFTKSDAEKLCIESIASHPAFAHVKESTAGFNVTQAILNCVFDTYEGQTKEWIQSYISAITDIANLNMERDPNYTDTHVNEVVNFRRLSCPLNCSGNGICTDKGKCSCTGGFRGSDCSINISAELIIYGVEGSRFCDVEEDDCDKIEIKTFDLVKGFVCKVEERKILIDGRKLNTSTNVLGGDFINFLTAGCQLPSQRKKRSLGDNSTTLASEYDVSISNDGNRFSEKVKIILFDPKCQTISNKSDGSATVYLKDSTCFIGGNCYLPFESSKDDNCYKCIPSANPLTWTIECTKTDNIHDESGLPVYAIAILSISPVVIIVVAAAILIRFKKTKKLPRVGSPGRRQIGPSKELSFPSVPRENTTTGSKILINGLN